MTRTIFVSKVSIVIYGAICIIFGFLLDRFNHKCDLALSGSHSLPIQIEKHEIPSSGNNEELLFAQKCLNPKNGWDAFYDQILKNNTIYDVIKNYDGELDIQGWGKWELYIPKLLEDVVKTTKDNSILIIEVGSWKGNSAVKHARGCQEITQKTGKACRVICIDSWLGSMEHYESPMLAPKTASEFSHDLFLKFLSNMKLSNVSDIVYPLRMPSNIAAHILHCFKIEADIIMIDADHDYKPVLSDIKLFYPLLRKEGILYGDDQKWKGVDMAVKEFTASKGDKIKYWAEGVCWFMRKNVEDVSFFERKNADDSFFGN